MYLNPIGQLAEEQLLAIESHRPEVALDEFIVMPNHVHAILWIIDNEHALPFDRASTSQIVPTPEMPSGGSRIISTPEMPSTDITCHVLRPTANRPHFSRSIDHLNNLVPSFSADRSTVRHFSKPIPRSMWTIIGAYKAAVTRELHLAQPGFSASVWHGRYYDHIVRNEADLQRIRRYIQDNPMRWQLDRERQEEEIHRGDLW